MAYPIYPSVDGDFNFPPEVRDALAKSAENKSAIESNPVVVAIKNKNTTQDGRLDSIESKNTTQDGRLTSVESKNTAQDGRLDTIESVIPVEISSVDFAGGFLDKNNKATELVFDLEGQVPTDILKDQLNRSGVVSILNAELATGILDENKRATELVVDHAGLVPNEIVRAQLSRNGMPSISGNLIASGFLDSEKRATELVVDHAGQVPSEITERWVPRSTPTLTKTRSIWGHSLAAGIAGGATPWAPMLADKLGVPVYNYGVGGASSAHVAARQGGKPALVTVEGGAIPASGSVNIFMDTDYMFGGVSANQPVVIRGVSGVMTKVADNGDGADCTFTRSTLGDSVVVPDGTPVFTQYGSNSRSDVTYIWGARNDFFKEGNSPEKSVENVARMVDYLTSVHKKVLILEEPPAVSETIGTESREEVDAYNSAIRAAFPQWWVPVMTWLRTDSAANAAGVEFTPQDLINIDSGVTPETFRVDTLHLSTLGNTALAHRIFTEELNRGWI